MKSVAWVCLRESEERFQLSNRMTNSKTTKVTELTNGDLSHSISRSASVLSHVPAPSRVRAREGMER